jgi:hypothetical protein
LLRPAQWRADESSLQILGLRSVGVGSSNARLSNSVLFLAAAMLCYIRRRELSKSKQHAIRNLLKEKKKRWAWRHQAGEFREFREPRNFRDLDRA